MHVKIPDALAQAAPIMDSEALLGCGSVDVVYDASQPVDANELQEYECYAKVSLTSTEKAWQKGRVVQKCAKTVRILLHCGRFVREVARDLNYTWRPAAQGNSKEPPSGLEPEAHVPPVPDVATPSQRDQRKILAQVRLIDAATMVKPPKGQISTETDEPSTDRASDIMSEARSSSPMDIDFFPSGAPIGIGTAPANAPTIKFL